MKVITGRFARSLPENTVQSFSLCPCVSLVLENESSWDVPTGS
jgi:hypothetical protein